MIRKLWNILNVQSESHGIRKKNPSCNPIRSPDDDKLQFLMDIAVWILEWDKDKKHCLSRETSLAMRQTCQATAGLAKYLIEEKHFRYVLTGKLQSDPLESRFGWYRQSAGGNFYLSVRQVLESEKCIRLISLAKFSEGSFVDVLGHPDREIDEYFATLEAQNIMECLSEPVGLDCEDPADANVVFYISGYIAKSIRGALTCDACKSELIASEESPKILIEASGSGDSSTNHTEFFENLNRGGLNTPSDLCFLACIYIYNLFSALMRNQSTRRQLLESQQVCSVFVEAIFISMEEEPLMDVFTKYCKVKHAFKGTLARLEQKCSIFS